MAKTLSSSEVIKKLKAAGFELVRVKGSHHQFKRAGVQWVVTVPHPKKELRRGTLKSIEEKSGVLME